MGFSRCGTPTARWAPRWPSIGSQRRSAFRPWSAISSLVRFDFTVQVLLTLVIGGTGMYVLARVMRIGVLGAAMAATAFELSGSFVSVLGWPIASVMSWAGWLFACTILVIRGRHRRRDVTLFAVVLALSIYAGEPDTLAVLIVAVVIFIVCVLASRFRRLSLGKAVGRPALDLGIGSVAGLGLAAPLLLPAAQLTVGSIRSTGRHPGFPPYEILHLVFQTFNGLALAGSGFVEGVASGNRFDAQGLGYISTAGYVGVIAIVLGVVGVVISRRRPAVLAFGVVAVLSACFVYIPPLVSLLNRLPGLGEVRWVRSLQILVFAVAILAGAGLDALIRSKDDRSTRTLLGAGFGSLGVILLAVWLFGRGDLPAVEAAIRAKSFIWPAAEVAVGLAVFGFLVVMSRRRRTSGPERHPLLREPSLTAGAVLLITSTVFLVVLGAPWWSSSTAYLAPTHAETTLQKAVGSSIVGFGNSSCLLPPTLGIQPDVNIVYGVHEFNSYDPLTPKRLFTSWTRASGSAPTSVGPTYALPVSLFCPAVKTVAEARLFGIGYVLEPLRKVPPKGSVLVKRVGDEKLYRIPGSSVATLTPLQNDGSLPPAKATGTPVAVTYPSPASWKVVTHTTTPQTLRLRLTNVPGWHASIDGKPLELLRFNSAMFQVKVPAGDHTIELHYWPDTFNLGIVVAAGTAVVLVLALVFGGRRPRRRRGAKATLTSDPPSGT